MRYVPATCAAFQTRFRSQPLLIILPKLSKTRVFFFAFAGKARRRLIVHRKFLSADSTFRSRTREKAVVSTVCVQKFTTANRDRQSGDVKRHHSNSYHVFVSSSGIWKLLNYNIGQAARSHTLCLLILGPARR